MWLSFLSCVKKPFFVLGVAFSFLCVEKQDVSLVFNLFSSRTSLKRFRGFLLVVWCEENVSILVVCCGFLLLVCGEARRVTCF